MTNPIDTQKRPQPVLTPQLIAAVITFAAGQAVAFGLIPEATSSKVVSSAPIAVGALFTVVAALHSIVAIFTARRVTPSVDPQAVVVRADGTKAIEPLVPLSLAVQAQPNPVGVEDPDDSFTDLLPGPAVAAG